MITSYFRGDMPNLTHIYPFKACTNDVRESIRLFIKTFSKQVPTGKHNNLICSNVCRFGKHQSTARAITRILHGIASPKYPKEHW
jgi:hypothetical protein